MTTRGAVSLPSRSLGGRKVICFARLAKGIRKTEKTTHNLTGGDPADFKGLVIVEERAGAAYYLFYCNEQWEVLTDTWHRTLDDAKSQAEFEFEGVAQAWESLPVDA